MNNTPDVIVLCGGAGIRLRSVVEDAPKSMARIGHRPFLELLLEKLDRSGFRRVILATGYQAEAIRDFFGGHFRNLELLYSRELTPLGTGGALRNAAELVTSDAALVTNGDSYTDADLTQFVIDFREAKADVSVLIVPSDGRDDCGTVTVDDDSAITSFNEKNPLVASRYLNAGIYMLSRRALYDIPEGARVSIEHDLLPYWVNYRRPVKAFVFHGSCVDIGTPERYRDAQHLLNFV